jgi:hypothetical protein
MTETTPKAIEVNCETGVVTERDLTAEEIAQREADAAAYAAAEAERADAAAVLAALKTSAKSKLVSGTPLTEAEAATLVI